LTPANTDRHVMSAYDTQKVQLTMTSAAELHFSTNEAETKN